MPTTHKLTYTLASSGGNLSGVQSEVGTTEISLDSYFPAGSSNAPLAASFTVASIQDVFLYSDKGLTLKTNGTGTAEVQTLTVTGTPTGGTVALAVGGEVAVPLAYNASASTVQAALQALSTVGTGNLTCTGGPWPGAAITATWAGTKATGHQPPIKAAAAFTGGTSPAIAVAVTTAGKPDDTITINAGTPLVWSKSAGYGDCPFTVDVTGLYISCTPSSRIQGRILTS